MIMAGSPFGNGSHDEKSANGVPYNHAFTVLGAKELTDAAGKKIRLVNIRNPWGKEWYSGAFSDKSPLWTDDLRKQAGSKIADDGEFFIPIADYMTDFEETQFSYNNKNMSRSHFLVLGDTNTETRQEGYCNGTCSYHKFTIKSKTTQKVYLKVTTW